MPAELRSASALMRACSVLSLAIAACLAGCSSSPKENYADLTAEQLAAAAHQDMDAHRWKAASERLSAIERRFPNSLEAQQALIDHAYVDWQGGEPEVALVVLDRFMRLYPNHPGTDYVLYLKGMANLSAARITIGPISLRDQNGRDTAYLRAGFMAFSEMRKRFPNSPYAEEALKHIVELAGIIAANELTVARYYYDHGAYVAAANRAQGVITDFEGTPVTEQALYLLKEIYGKMGMLEELDEVQRVFDSTYPDSKLPETGLPK